MLCCQCPSQMTRCDRCVPLTHAEQVLSTTMRLLECVHLFPMVHQPQGLYVYFFFPLIHRSHSISFTRAQGIPKYNIGFVCVPVSMAWC